MRNYGLSDKVRSVARTKYVLPALNSGKTSFSIRVRNMLEDLAPMGFPSGHTPQICSALRSARFQEENGLEVVAVEGPPSGMSPTVVVRYRVKQQEQGKAVSRTAKDDVHFPAEDAKARARRLAEGLRGLLREELAGYGGGEAFLKWVRSEEDAA